MGGCRRRLRSRIGRGQRRQFAATACGCAAARPAGQRKTSKRRSHSRNSTRRCARPICCCRPADLRPLCSIWATPRRSTRRRIPLATWFRFRQAADRARTCLVVLAETGCAQSSAAVTLECAALRPVIVGETVLRGFHFEVRRERQRFTPFVMGQKKPPACVWPAIGAWDKGADGMSEDCMPACTPRSFRRRPCCACGPICSRCRSRCSRAARLLSRSAQ